MSNRIIDRIYLSENGKASFRDRADAVLAGLWGERALVIGLIIIALVAHAFNMFHYPSITRNEDEGIYMSQAWAVLREGRLTPYTYWYDHAPAGWIFIAGWMRATGGPHAFGTAVDSGRVFMLVLHLGMVPLLYLVARKLGVSSPLAALCVFLFSVSPLAIPHQRMVLLDNIMMFWMLVSLNLLLDGWGRLTRMVLSGMFFGLAVVSKITAVFLIPAFIYIAFQQRWQHQGRFAVWGWIMPMMMVVSLFFLYAIFKGELFPQPASSWILIIPEWLRDRFFAGEGQISLIETLRWQGSRPGGSILEPDSLIRLRIRYDWLPVDPFLFVGGIIATFVNFIRGFRNRFAMSAALLGALPLVYIFRGGVVFDFYIIFNIPFLALNIAVLLTSFEKFLSSRRVVIAGTSVASLGLLLFYFGTGRSTVLYQYKPDQPAREALTWIKGNIHPESRMIIGDDMWTDLREPGIGGPTFPHAHSHWKVALDPEVRYGIFQDNWEYVDYVVLHQESLESYKSVDNELAFEALANATLLNRWGDDLYFVEIWKVNKGSQTDKDLLKSSHLFIKRNFSRHGAYYNDDGTVTSENQAYAMLRSVWLDDPVGFSQTWSWTRENLMTENGTLAWLWKDGQILDLNTATDADTDAALALLFAGRRWENPSLIEAGTRLAAAVWDNNVAEVNGKPYLTAGEWAIDNEIIVINPSYFSPYAYRIFNEIDPERGWDDLIDTSYEVILASAKANFGKPRSAGLPPDWVGMDRSTGQLVPVDLEGGFEETTRFGYEAARIYWRVALDLRYTEDGRAKTFLELAGFIQDEVQRKGYLSASYSQDGQVLEHHPSMVTTAAALAVLLDRDPMKANELYVQQILLPRVRYMDRSISWGEPRDLYAQEWGWFAVGLYADALPNLWWDATED
jgi:endo-1,4-beta-D-glucanase Y